MPCGWRLQERTSSSWWLPAVILASMVLQRLEPKVDGGVTGEPPLNKLFKTPDLGTASALGPLSLRLRGGGKGSWAWCVKFPNGLNLQFDPGAHSWWSLICCDDALPLHQIFWSKGDLGTLASVDAVPVISSQPACYKGGSSDFCEASVTLSSSKQLAMERRRAHRPKWFRPRWRWIRFSVEISLGTGLHFYFLFWGPFCKMHGPVCNFCFLWGPVACCNLPRVI